MGLADQAPIDRFDLPHPGGEGHFRISVWAGEAQAGGALPVLFVTDADLVFATAVEIARLHGFGGTRPTAMVVGIGYGAPDLAALAARRTPDLTPPLDQALLGFIVDTLKPEIARRYPQASAGRHALFGHSLGGLFTAGALLRRPDAFEAFLVGSAALWWDGFSTLELARAPAFAAEVAAQARKPRVFIGVGGDEPDLEYRVIEGSADLARTLREPGLDEVSFATFDGEDHVSVIPALLMRALRVFTAPAPTS